MRFHPHTITARFRAIRRFLGDAVAAERPASPPLQGYPFTPSPAGGRSRR